MDEDFSDPYSVVRIQHEINNYDVPPLYLENALAPVVSTSAEKKFGVYVEEGSTDILDYVPRGTPVEQQTLERGKLNEIEIPGFGGGFTVSADERGDRASAPTGKELIRSQEIVTRHLDRFDTRFRATAERQLAHAVRGFITDKQENVLLDLYEELGTEQQDHVIDVTDKSVNWVRQMQGGMNKVDDGLVNENAPSYMLLPGPGVHKWMETDVTYIQGSTSEAAYRLNLEDNRKGVRVSNSLNVLPSRKGYFEEFECHLVPVIPGFWRRILGPSDSADYEGQNFERYTTMEKIRHGGGWEYQIKSFMLQFARKPRGVVKVRFLGIPGGPTS